MKKWIIALTCCSTFFTLSAQSDWINQLTQDEYQAVEAISMYPEETRDLILLASGYPEVFVRQKMISDRTQTAFVDALKALSQVQQETVWDMTRYPGLIESIAEQAPDKKKLSAIAKNYPESMQDNIELFGKSFPQVFKDIYALRLSADLAFETVIESYAENVQEAFRKLLDLPEVLSILTENISLTVLIGDMYRQDPAMVNSTLTALEQDAEMQQAKQVADWKTQLENDPQMRAEFEAAAIEYAEENGYSKEEYTTAPPATREVRVNYVYPYWYGYPYWYSYPRWRPYPYWYDWGYYYGPSGALVVYGMPSFYFFHWYYYHPYHHYYYPYFTNGCYVYYRGHRSYQTPMTYAVDNWVQNSSDVLGTGWLNDDEQRPEKIRSYGQLETDFANQNNAGTIRNPVESKRQFLQQNADKYAALPVPQKSKAVQQPSVSAPKSTYSTAPPKVNPVVSKPRPVATEKPVVRPSRAEEYHQQKWTAPRPTAPRSSPAPVPSRAPTPKATKPAPQKPRVPRSPK